MCNGTHEAHSVAAAVTAIGRRTIAVVADVSDSAAVTAMIGAVRRGLAPIDILISIIRGIDDLTEADFDATIAVNLKSVFLCTQTVLHTCVAAVVHEITAISMTYHEGDVLIRNNIPQ